MRNKRGFRSQPWPGVFAAMMASRIAAGGGNVGGFVSIEHQRLTKSSRSIIRIPILVPEFIKIRGIDAYSWSADGTVNSYATPLYGLSRGYPSLRWYAPVYHRGPFTPCSPLPSLLAATEAVRTPVARLALTLPSSSTCSPPAVQPPGVHTCSLSRAGC